MSIYLITGVFFWEWSIPLRSQIKILKEISSLGENINISIFNGILLYDHDTNTPFPGVIYEKDRAGTLCKNASIDRLDINKNKIFFLKEYDDSSDSFKINLEKKADTNIWEGSWFRCYRDRQDELNKDRLNNKGIIRCCINKVDHEFFTSLSESDTRELIEGSIKYSYADYIKLSDEEKKQLFCIVDFLYEPFVKKYFEDFPEKDWLLISANPLMVIDNGSDFFDLSKDDLDDISKKKNKPVFLFKRPLTR